MHRPVAFIGASGSGKTSLIIELIRHYLRRGISTAAMKHGHHEPGSGSNDTSRFLEAGAVQTLYAAGDRYWIFRRNGGREEGRFVLPEELPGFLSADRILIEGFKHVPSWPRILVERRGVSAIPVLADELAGIVTDEPGDSSLISFAPDAVESIARFVDRISPG